VNDVMERSLVVVISCLSQCVSYVFGSAVKLCPEDASAWGNYARYDIIQPPSLSYHRSEPLTEFVGLLVCAIYDPRLGTCDVGVSNSLSPLCVYVICAW
jgi:hypothetical protein